MEIKQICIEIEDECTCSRSCAFLQDEDCLLFNTSLTDTVLKDDECWQHETKPTKQRYYRCMFFD